MATRLWLATLGAPLVACAVYALVAFVLLENVTTGEPPTIIGFLLPSVAACIAFEIAIVTPIFRALKGRRFRLALFLASGAMAWFPIWILPLALFFGAASALLTAFIALPAGLTLLVAYWFLRGSDAEA